MLFENIYLDVQFLLKPVRQYSSQRAANKTAALQREIKESDNEDTDDDEINDKIKTNNQQDDDINCNNTEERVSQVQKTENDHDEDYNML